MPALVKGECLAFSLKTANQPQKFTIHNTHLENLHSMEEEVFSTGAMMELRTFVNQPFGVAVWIGRGTSGVVVVTHPV